MTPRIGTMLKRILTACGCMFLVLVGVEVLLPTGVREVRIDTGDRRTQGFLVNWPEPSVPGREYLVTAAAEIGIPAEWHKSPFIAPSYPDQGRYFLYSRTAWWAEHEPALGKIILQQIADYYRHPPAESGYPPAAAFLFMLKQADELGYALNDDYLSSLDEESLRYMLSEINYSPAPGGLIAGLLANRARQ